MTLKTDDQIDIEAELCVPDNPRAAVVVLHPHSLRDGSMYAIVPSEIMRTFPEHDIAVLRLNFRGVGKSQGSFEDGVGEVHDAIAGIKAAFDILEGLPIVLMGSSFGADVALSVFDDRLDGWCASAPPMRLEKLSRFERTGHNPRPKFIAIPERDELRTPDEVRDFTRTWQSTEVMVIKGATHMLVGRVEETVAAMREFILRVPSRHDPA